MSYILNSDECSYLDNEYCDDDQCDTCSRKAMGDDW